MLYLASPYSSELPHVREERYQQALKCTAALLVKHNWVYSPIVHCHELAKLYALPTSFEFWKRYNFAMLRRCETFGILKIDGWDESVGLSEEFKLARTLSMPTYFYNVAGQVII